MGKIPDEVRKQIEERFPDNRANALLGNNIKQLRQSAEFGYSLASKALSDANKEIERRGELLVHWWKVANRIKEGEAKSILDADEFLEYQLAIEKKVEQFKTENNL